MTKSSRFTSWQWLNNASFRLAPETINESYDYNKIGFGTTLAKSFDLLDATARVGADFSRTRGKKRRKLQEFYQPLSTFIPGGGAGYNNLSFPIIGNGGLFDARYGNTQARARMSYTFPLIEDVDKLLRIFYWDSLMWSSFLNYGGAWYGGEPSQNNLITAHGHTVNFNFDIKGVNFQCGLGLGQVFGSGLEHYATFSFNAIF